jgi:hypothetical protein
MMHTMEIERSKVLELAAKASCDPRTAKRYILGQPVKGELVRERLARAANDLEISVPGTKAKRR